MKYFEPKIKSLLQVALILPLLVGACTLRVVAPDKSTDKKATQVTTVVVNRDMNTSDLADAGEQLVTPYTFMLADKTFQMALEKDPAQPKALFYQALLKRFMIFKGILTRIKPLVEKHGNIVEYNQKVKNLPETPLKKFLLDGRPDISDLYSAQTFLNQYVRSVNYLREFLIKNPDLNITIYLNPYLFQGHINETWGKSCKTENDEDMFSVQCNAEDVALKKVNSADLLILRQIAAGEVLAFSLYASYSLEDYEKIAKLSQFNEHPYESKVRIIKSYRQLGTLRVDHVMALWSDIAQDFVAGMRWAEKYQSDLCPLGPEAKDQEQRKGHIFNLGYCLKNDETESRERETILVQLERALRGSIPLDLKGTNPTQPMEFHSFIDPLIVARRPILDLKTLLPEQEPTCGSKTKLIDGSLGGLFPKGDAGQYFDFQACQAE